MTRIIGGEVTRPSSISDKDVINIGMEHEVNLGDPLLAFKMAFTNKFLGSINFRDRVFDHVIVSGIMSPVRSWQNSCFTVFMSPCPLHGAPFLI